jgi:glycine cleavage system H protein
MANVRGFEFPDELHYLVDQDVWARPEADGNITVGVTSLAAHLAVEFYGYMPKPVGTAVDQNRAFAAVEMSKTIRSARAPVAGTIVAVNVDAVARPALINEDPYGKGWLARFAPADWVRDARTLITGAAIPAAMEHYLALNLIDPPADP